VTPSAGRFFHADIDGFGSQPTVVISYRFWQTYLDSVQDVVGSALGLNGHEFVIIGIGPEGFRGAFPARPAEVFVPVSAGPAIAPELRDNILHKLDAPRFRVMFRLADGVTIPKAEAALQVLTKNLDEQRPETERPSEERTVTLMEAGIVQPSPRRQRQAMWTLMGFSWGMILGIACANLAILLLARGCERRKEFTIRRSVGASRFRLMRQHLTEIVILSLAGGAVGILFTHWLLKLMSGQARMQSSVMACSVEAT
jgi:putative ABC transport system permease protein